MPPRAAVTSTFPLARDRYHRAFLPGLLVRRISLSASRTALRQQTTYKDAATRVSFTPDNPAVNAVSRHLISFCPDPTLTAEALAEKAMYPPTLPILDTSKVAWDEVLPHLQAVCRTIAVTKGGRTKASRNLGRVHNLT